MQPITLDQLRKICPLARLAKLRELVATLNAALEEFAIATPKRQIPFIAQTAHESGGFNYVREIASGAAYEGREDLGNTEPGDGRRFPGRAWMQITGRKNYGLCGAALGLDLLKHPELLEHPLHAWRASGWFWTVGAGLNLSKRALAHGIPVGVNLNDLADADDFQGITLAINGGLNGLADRVAYRDRAEIAIV